MLQLRRLLAAAGRATAGLAAAVVLAAAPLSAQPQRPVPAPAPAPAAAPATPLPPRPAALKTFQRPDLVTGARRYERQLARDAKPLTQPADRARRDADAAFQRMDARGAAALYAALASATPQDFQVWMRLARSLSAIKPNDDENAATFTDNATAAAYIAYRRAATKAEEGEALAFIGRIYAQRGLWSAAIETMKESLELRDNAAERAFYEKLRDEHGFRLINYTVEADQAAPRACVQFSEDLARGTDASAFVQVAGIDKPALSAEARQICVEGLKHGERYTVRVRPGIPAVTGEVLRKPAELSLYVRDRAASVHFSGKAYVLPSVGQKGIPLTSVNTRAVKVEVLRIGDRGLVPNAIQGEFQQALYDYVRERLADGAGIKVFSGTLDVDSPLNREVVTAVPVGEAVGKLEAGVYVMTAAPADATAQDDYGAPATQWFIVSDLGLTALSGQSGVSVLVRSLASAEPVNDVEVRLVAKSNEVLGTVRSDANGVARFDPGLARGPAGLQPEVVIARTTGGDYAFLSLRDGAFDLTDRGVAGRETPGALDAFVTPERGVYRSGETVHVTALLRDPQGRAVPSLPLTLVLQRPDGVEDRRLVVNDEGAGGRTVDFTLLKAAMTGTWRVRAFADPKAKPVGETAFLVEDYVPDRIEFTLASPDKVLPRNRPAEVRLDGRFLFGAPAAGLDVEAESVLRVVDERAAFAGFRFGNTEDEVLSQSGPVADAPRTDAAGRATLRVVPPALPKTDRPLELSTTVRLVEPGGRAVSRAISLPIRAAGDTIGVKPLFSDRVAEKEQAKFDVIVATPDDRMTAASGLKWQLSRIETRYQWYRVSGSWDYEAVKIVSRVGEGRLDVTADAGTRLAVPVEYGRYRLDISGDGLPLTSYAFEAGYGGTAPDTPDRLDLTLDREAYASGDTLTATLTSRSAGTATLLVMNEGLLDSRVIKIAAGANKASFKVEPNWGPGAYVVALSHRPLDAAASRMPGRAIGVAWFSVDRDARTLKVELSPPAAARPGDTLKVPVRVGVKPGEKAFVTLAAVDVGILNLTGFEPPEPDEAIFGQRRLSAEVRDLYGALIDGMQGNAGRLRSGGDGSGGGLQASPPTQPPLALFAGPVEVKADGTAEIAFPLPPFDGTVRLMAMAWSADRLGHASTDVIVRDKVVILATLPRFLAAGDRSTLNLDLTNVEAPAGDFRLDVTASGGAVAGAPPASGVRLAAGQRQSVKLDLTGIGIGPATIAARISGQGVDITRTFALNVRPAYPEIERRTVRNLAPNESLQLSEALVADLVPGSGAVSVSVTPSTAIDVPALLVALDRYPYGCTEQLISRALPLLYYNEVAALVRKAPDAEADKRIRDAVTRVLARQGSDGSFGLWSPGGEDTWLDAYVADFLTRAREKGVPVPDLAFNQALDRLRNVVNLAGAEMQSTSEGLAYALYVLARNGRAPLGDLRFIADTRLKDLSSALSQGQVGAALALLGDRARAERAFTVAVEGLPSSPAAPQAGRADFGSVLRDAAALTALAREAGMDRVAEVALARVDAARVRTERTSTQENAWLILAARSLAQSARDIALDVNGSLERGPYGATLGRADFTRGPTTLRNRGAEAVKVVVAVNGAPQVAEPAAARGFTLERRYYTLDGKPFDPAKAVQNQRFVVVLKASEQDTVRADILLVDYLPAGFEIENPRLQGRKSAEDEGADANQDQAFAWLGEVTDAKHIEVRDDRFVAAHTRAEGDEPFVVAYVARAVSPGRYAHPPAVVEDMYRPDRFARTGAGTIDVAPAR